MVQVKATHQRGPVALYGNQPQRTSFATRRKQPVDCQYRASTLYQKALELARDEDYQQARKMFEQAILECPSYDKPYISLSRMELRALEESEERWSRCREVLQRALVINPSSARVLQAWGLMELKRGNFIAAVMLLERAIVFDQCLMPVLRWKPVVVAKENVVERRQQRQKSNL